MEAPEEFFTKKSLNKLPLLAFLTWIIMFMIDAVFFRHESNPSDRHINFLVTGLIVSVFLSLLRVFSLPQKTGWDFGFVFLNALIILFSAAGLQGGTKELAQLGYADSADSTAKEKKAALADVSVFANQTSYFPDFKVIAEKEKLAAENERLQQSLTLEQSELVSKLGALETTNKKLEVSLNECLHNYQTLQGDFENLQDGNNKPENPCPPADDPDLERKYNALLRDVGKLNQMITSLQEIRRNSCVLESEKNFLKSMIITCRSQDQKVDAKLYLDIIGNLRPVN